MPQNSAKASWSAQGALAQFCCAFFGGAQKVHPKNSPSPQQPFINAKRLSTATAFPTTVILPAQEEINSEYVTHIRPNPVKRFRRLHGRWHKIPLPTRNAEVVGDWQQVVGGDDAGVDGGGLRRPRGVSGAAAGSVRLQLVMMAAAAALNDPRRSCGQ